MKIDMDLIKRAAGAAMAAAGSITLSPQFKIVQQDAKLSNNTAATKQAAAMAAQPNADLPPGVLANFQGTWTGVGFNQIFRPSNPSSDPVGQKSSNILELNLMNETLSFSLPIGQVPNRGAGNQVKSSFNQPDVNLTGVSYLQSINDVSNPLTGQADGTPLGIHLEPGLWMSVPATNVDPVLAQSINRMGSIPHGTTINAQGLEPTQTFTGAPEFSVVNINPFPFGNPGGNFRFPSQNATAQGQARLPQDLTKFIQAGTITQAILDDPNQVLRNSNDGLNIVNFKVFVIDTAPVSPILGGGTANNAFLSGDDPTQSANAFAPQMNATFWIESVSWTLTVPASRAGQTQLIKPVVNNPFAMIPTFQVTPPQDVAQPTNITVFSTQIQYSQHLLLNFDTLSWPHNSVNTLMPANAIVVPASAFQSSKKA